MFFHPEKSCKTLIFAAFLGISLSAGQAIAQRGEMDRATALLPKDARPAVERLAALHELPDGTWKIHPGDIAHAEDANLDDSSWPVIKPGDKAPNDAVWFRQTVQVPTTLNGYDLTGARIWFQIDVSANGPMPEIIYFNGRRVALGDDLEPIVLFDKAQPGDKATIAVKFLHTVDVKTFRRATMRIDYAEGRPNPEDLREEFLSAALLVPSLAPGDASKEAVLADAIHAVDLGALDAHDQTRFDASLKAAQQKLEALRPLISQAAFHLDGNAHIDAAWLWPWTETVDAVKRTFSTALQLMYEYPDYKFTQSAAAYNEWMAEKYPDINAEIAQRIKEGRWEIVGGMWVEPDLNLPDGESLVRQLLVGKRWYKQAYGVDVRIGWNPDSFGYTWQLPQIYKKSGIDYFVTQKMTWNDTNQLPFKLFWWESPDGSKVLTYFPHDYVNTTLDPVRLAEDLKSARKFAPGMTEMLDLYGIGDHGGGPTRAMLDEGFHWAGLTGHGAGCLVTGHDLSRAESAPSLKGASAPAEASGCAVTPNFQFGTAQSYFSSIEKKIAPESTTWDYRSIPHYEAPAAMAGQISIPTWKSELYFEYHRGIMTTQANHKANMRHSEEQVLNAEKFSSIAWLFGQKYPGDELTEDWKKVLFNQFHDLAAGSGIGVIYKDAQKDYDWVRMSTSEISDKSLATVAEQIDTSGDKSDTTGQTIVVFNPLGWVRGGEIAVGLSDYPHGFLVRNLKTGWTEASNLFSTDTQDGKLRYRIPVEGVPAFGYTVLQILPASLDREMLISDQPRVDEEEHDFVFHFGGGSVVVNKDTGCIISIRRGRNDEYLAPGACGNELQFFKDLPKDYDAWNIDPGTLDREPELISKADSVELVGKYPYQAVRVTRHWQNSKFVQTISMPRASGLIDIENDIDWHEKHVLLKAAFPLAVKSDFATYEIPYGAIERPTTRNNSWEKAQFEVPAMRWADLGDGKHGLSLLNQTKYGYDAVGNTLRISLLRAPTWPDPDADQGHHHFHYALYPHAGTWKDALTVRHGWEYDYPLQAVVTTAHAGSLPAEHSFASVSPENVVLTAVKKAEDADGLIFRVYEWAGKPATAEFHVPEGATSATVTNLMEVPQGDAIPVEDGVVKVPIHPYEILTLCVRFAKNTSLR